MNRGQPILELKGICKAFSGVPALSNVDFDLLSGEVHALVGENGAGKSTLMKVLTGAYQMDAGQITLDGRRVEVRDVNHSRQLGISMIFQELSQIRQLTVAQNIFLGREPRGFLGLLDERTLTRSAAPLLEEYKIHLNPRELVAGLSAADRQLTEIVKAVSLGSKIIIMDEPTSSLTLNETENLFRIIGDLRRKGIGVIFISHRMDEIRRVADRVSVLRDGRSVGTFGSAEISLQGIVSLMVGRELEAVDSAKVTDENRIGAPLLEVRNLSRAGVLDSISFTLHRGEILGLAGLVGSGRSEVARAIFGVDRFDTGDIDIAGAPLRAGNPAEAMRAGLALLPEERREQGLVLCHSVEDNINLPILRDHERGGFADFAACHRIVLDSISRLHIVPPDPTRIVQLLSGGNQQKVVAAKWLATQPRVLIADEPTIGIDVGAKAELHQLLRDLAGAGVGILLISSDMPEIISLSDRIMVMHDGVICGELARAEVTQQRIMEMILEHALRGGRYASWPEATVN